MQQSVLGSPPEFNAASAESDPLRRVVFFVRQRLMIGSGMSGNALN